MTCTMIFRRLFLLLMIIGVGVTACAPPVEPVTEPLNTPITKPTDEPDAYPSPEEPELEEGYPAPEEVAAYDPYPEPDPEESSDDLVLDDADDAYKLAQGQTVQISSGEALTFVSVEDSRCPADATCVWAGSLIVDLAVTAVDGTVESIRLSLDDPQIAAAALLPSGFPIALADDGTQQVEQGNERLIRVMVGHLALDEQGDVVDNAGVVETLEVALLESFPLQATAFVTGYFSNGCWSLAEVLVIQTEATHFVVNVRGRHSGDEVCTEALVPFEETAEIPINQLPAGTYTVEAGEVTTSFELQVDNMLEMPDEKPNLQIGEADVTDASIMIDEAAGVATLEVTGYLRDGCTNIHDVVLGELANGTLPIAIMTSRDPNMMCTMALVDYQESFEISLNGFDLAQLERFDINGFIIETQ